MEQKLTEDQTIEILMNHLKSSNWTIESFCLGQQRGYDIVALKEQVHMFIEVKGARASDDSPTKKRKYFDSGQIKDHFGKAIVKSMETKNAYPRATIAIAHPDDVNIRNAIGGIIKNINSLGIIHFWVNSNGKVNEVS